MFLFGMIYVGYEDVLYQQISSIFTKLAVYNMILISLGFKFWIFLMVDKTTLTLQVWRNNLFQFPPLLLYLPDYLS